MRIFFAGLIGAAVTTVVWLALEYVTLMDFGWLSCGVGVVTGYCVHRAAGPHSGGSFVRGALSVLLTLAVIVGGRQVYAKVMNTITVRAQVVPVMSDSETKDTSGETVGEVDRAIPRLASEAELRGGPFGLDSGSPLAQKKAFSDWDMLWMCLAALAAYVIGKGRDEVAAPSTSDQPQLESQPPPADSQ